MKSHGPDSPLTIRGLRNRYSRRGLLDTRKQVEADLNTAEVVMPWGKSFDMMKNPGSDQGFIVANLAGGTLAPGTSGLLANTSGRPGGQSRLGKAPAGKKGAGNASRSLRRRGVASVPANQYAFTEADGGTYALLYADGVFVSQRALSGTLAGSPFGCILTDESELVGVGSLLFRSGNDLGVWDVESETVYDYAAPAGWRALTGPHYRGGFLYWFEGQDIVDHVTTSFNVRLRKATTDLVTVSTVQTETRTTTQAAADLGGLVAFFLDTAEYTASMGVTDTGAVVYMGIRPQDENDERVDVWQTQFRFGLVAGAPSSREWATPEGTDFQSATVSGTSIAVLIPRPDVGPSVQSVMAKSDDASVAMSDLWSTDTLNPVGILNISANEAGSVLQVHSTNGYIVRGVASGAVITTTIEPFNATPSYPDVMYFFGD